MSESEHNQASLMNGQAKRDAAQLESFGYKPQLKRVLSLWDLTVYGLLFMVIIAPHSIFGFVNADSRGMAPFVYCHSKVIMSGLSKVEMS